MEEGMIPLRPRIPGLGASTSTDPLETVLGPFPCARLRNLPFNCTIEEILALFQGLIVIDVVLIGPGGKEEAFVIFANTMDYQMALQRDRQPIGLSYVKISQGSRLEYYSAIATVRTLPQKRGTYHSRCSLKMSQRFLHSCFSQQQWQEHSKKSRLLRTDNDKLWMGKDDDDDQKGDANASDIWESMGLTAPTIPPLNNTLPEKKMDTERKGRSGEFSTGGGRNRGGSGKGMSLGTQQQQQRQVKKRSSGGGGIQIGEHTGFLRMRGLPFSATKEDISKFFEGYNPILDCIVLTYRSDGRPTGEAYVAFESPDDSERAMELQRTSIRTRYIELFLSNKEEHGRALTRFANH